MERKKKKNYHQKNLIIFGVGIMIFGMVYIHKPKDDIAYQYSNLSTEFNLLSKNNTIAKTTYDRRGWKTAEDEKIAIELQEYAKKRIDTLEGVNQELDLLIDKDKKKEKCIHFIIRNNEYQIIELKKGIEEIKDIGTNKDYIITYKYTEVEKDSAYHVRMLSNDYKGKTLLSVEYSNKAIAIHESRHVFQYMTEGKKEGYMLFNKDSVLSFHKGVKVALLYCEIKAHQLQYAFSNGSISNILFLFDINEEWLKSIPENPYKIE